MPDTWCCSTVSYCLLFILLGSWIVKRDSAVIFIQYHRNVTQKCRCIAISWLVMSLQFSEKCKSSRDRNSNTQISSQTKNTMMINICGFANHSIDLANLLLFLNLNYEKNGWGDSRIPGSTIWGVVKKRREFCVRFAQIGPLSCHPLKPNWTDPGQLVEPLFPWPVKHQSGLPLKNRKDKAKGCVTLYFFWKGPTKSRM